MLGIDGKEKPVYVEGDKLLCVIDGIGYDVVVRGKAYENLIDIWIVEFVGGSPDEATYPYSCATIPHTMLAPPRVVLQAPTRTLEEAMDTLTDADKTIWAHFGLDPMPYNLCDMRMNPWVRQGARSVGWWESTEQLQQVQEVAESDDPEDWDIMYGGTIYGTSLWSTAEYTVAVLDDGCGNRDAYLFANKNKNGGK